ncbi:hypothetical protein [Tabrizicola flagellatus]|uniref:hypothetical protein n=1 Tax=Tabrizicola flagellatus TaxID=2593021 RepID=UPI0011F1ECDD|nr:hypothetical protein [Tabrizicola flagellatus]
MILRFAALWLTAAAALWLHALLGIPGDYLGRGFPLYPGIQVTRTELAVTALAATLPIPLFAALARRFHLRRLVLPPIVLFWLWAASVMIHPFVIDFGTTWSGTEPLRALFLHPLHTPLALLALLAATALTLGPARRK